MSGSCADVLRRGGPQDYRKLTALLIGQFWGAVDDLLNVMVDAGARFGRVHGTAAPKLRVGDRAGKGWHLIPRVRETSLASGSYPSGKLMRCWRSPSAAPGSLPGPSNEPMVAATSAPMQPFEVDRAAPSFAQRPRLDRADGTTCPAASGSCGQSRKFPGIRAVHAERRRTTSQGARDPSASFPRTGLGGCLACERGRLARAKTVLVAG